jgi:hypothetical protein
MVLSFLKVHPAILMRVVFAHETKLQLKENLGRHLGKSFMFELWTFLVSRERFNI